jgi:hypothetical protein
MEINLNNIEFLITEINSKNIKKLITDNISDLFTIYEKNKPIPIYYYTKNLTEKKDKCSICHRKSFYFDNYKNYCWIHAQSY